MEFLFKTVAADRPLAQYEAVLDHRYTLTLSAEEEPGGVLSDVSATFRFDFRKGDMYFLNGYQSWTYSPERTREEYDTSMRFRPPFLEKRYGFTRYGDRGFCPPLSQKELRRGVKRGWSYAYVRRGGTFYLFASLAEYSGFTRVELDPGENTVTVTKDCALRRLKPGEGYTALDLYFAAGSEDEVFDGWFAAMGVKALPAEAKTGYTSWYNYYQNIGEAQILRDLEGMKTLPVKPGIFQIDDGFERWVGDWLDVDGQKFPHGLEPIIRCVADEGYQAGIWLAPFLCEKNSALYREHPNWLLWDGGAPAFAGGNWSGAYALDIYNGEVRDYIRRSIGHYKAMGVTLFKLDFLYAACMLPRPDKTRGEIMWEAMDFLRETCGEAQILGCGVPLASAFGKVEYCRVGPDMSLSFDDMPYMRLFHAERPSTKHTERNTVYRRQLDRRAFLNDPDVFLLRDGNNALTRAQKETLAAVNALFGSVLFASDDFGRYDEEKRDLFARLCRLRHAENVTVTMGKHHALTVRFTLDGEEKRLELRI